MNSRRVFHMSPAGDRWNGEAMAESFTAANIVPQNRNNNEHLWARTESAALFTE